MYIVINKKTKEVLHINQESTQLNLEGRDVYEHFSDQEMDIIKTDKLIPSHFNINSKNKIIESPQKERFQAGFLSLEEWLDPIAAGGQVEEIKRISQNLLKSKQLKFSDQCEKLIQLINLCLSQRIAQNYEISYEMKITKDYIAWMQAGSPKNDIRSEKYEAMQELINRERTSIKRIKSRIQELAKELPKMKPEPYPEILPIPEEN